MCAHTYAPFHTYTTICAHNIAAARQKWVGGACDACVRSCASLGNCRQQCTAKLIRVARVLRSATHTHTCPRLRYEFCRHRRSNQSVECRNSICVTTLACPWHFCQRMLLSAAITQVHRKPPHRQLLYANSAIINVVMRAAVCCAELCVLWRYKLLSTVYDLRRIEAILILNYSVLL